MAGSVVDTIKRTVSGAVKVGRQVGGRAVATAGPRIVRSVEAVRSRLTAPHPKPPTTPTPREELPEQTTPRASRPNPATVAKNIAKHDPASAPVIPKRKPVKRSVPGAKLPAPKKD